MEVDQLEINKLKKIIESPTLFIENFCYIITKKATFELFKPNKPQKIILDYVEECLREKKPIRVRILKARQMGFSTLISAIGFWWATMHENSSYAVVAHKEDSTMSIFDKNRIFYNNLPVWLKPATNRFSSEAISYDKVDNGDGGGLRSKIFFGTAGGNELFRGETILFCHKSEKAFWENVDILNKSLNAAIPKEPFTAIFDESTANGYNHYKDECEASARGENEYKFFFFGWNMMDDYQMPVEEGFKLLPIEEEYMLMHDLTPEQMRWRRYKIVNDYNYTLRDIENDDIDDFKQEYPLIPEEAFISSGRSVFSPKVTKKGMEYSKLYKYSKEYELQSFPCKENLIMYEDPEMEEIKEYDKEVYYNKETQKYEYRDTDLLIGKKYKYANYVLGIDTSGAGQDRNVITVWHTHDKKMVARWSKTNISEENLAKIAVEIAKIYNYGMIAPEVNFSHSLVSFIEDLEYENIYVCENESRIDKKNTSLEYGWKTTSKTKPLLVSNMKRAINEDYKIIPDPEFWYEADYYIQEKTKSGQDTFNAASGKHDDIVMAAMIGLYVCDSSQVNQNYTISKDKELYEKIEQKKKKDSIINIGGVLLGQNPNSKGNHKFKKGVFKNYA